MHTYKLNTAPPPPLAELVRSKKPRAKAPQPTEHDLQAAVVKWARLHEKRYPALAMLHATPNGGHRHIAVAKKLKAEGVSAGYPDLSLDYAAHGFHGLRIELKTNIGRLSEEQSVWLDKLNKAGYMAVVCRGFDAAVDTLKSYVGVIE
jgi:hypothetical protein